MAVNIAPFQRLKILEFEKEKKASFKVLTVINIAMEDLFYKTEICVNHLIFTARKWV